VVAVLSRAAVTFAVALLACVGAAVPAGAGDVEATPIPAPGRTEVAGAHWGEFGLAAVSGGFVPGAGTDATADLLFFDLATGEWRAGPALPGPRDHAAMVVLDDSLYLVGGYTGGLTDPTDGVFRLDAPDGEWQEVGSMSTPRGALAATAIQGRLVALGGVDDTGEVLASVEVYDPDADRWTEAPAMSVPREHFGAAALDGRVWAIAGRNPGNLTSVESIRFRRGRPGGSFRDEAPLGFARGGSGAAAAGRVVCTAGGEEQAGTIAPVECLADGEWRHVADLDVPRHGLAVVGVGRDLRVISGGPEPGLAFGREHEVFDVRALLRMTDAP